jgi:hypothetical protein
MRVEVLPVARRRFSPWGIVPAATVAIVIGVTHAGFLSLAISVGIALLVVLIAWSTPRINQVVYRRRPRTLGPGLSASGIFEHKAGSVDMTAEAVTWRPYRARSKPPQTILLASVDSVDVVPLPGVPRSCRAVFHTTNGDTQVTVFAPADQLADAIQQKTPPPS